MYPVTVTKKTTKRIFPYLQNTFTTQLWENIYFTQTAANFSVILHPLKLKETLNTLSGEANMGRYHILIYLHRYFNTGSSRNSHFLYPFYLPLKRLISKDVNKAAKVTYTGLRSWRRPSWECWERDDWLYSYSGIRHPAGWAVAWPWRSSCGAGVSRTPPWCRPESLRVKRHCLELRL